MGIEPKTPINTTCYRDYNSKLGTPASLTVCLRRPDFSWFFRCLLCRGGASIGEKVGLFILSSAADPFSLAVGEHLFN